jgi:hypothetical protein
MSKVIQQNNKLQSVLMTGLNSGCFLNYGMMNGGKNKGKKKIADFCIEPYKAYKGI